MPNKNTQSTSILVLILVALIAPVVIYTVIYTASIFAAETPTTITISDTILAPNAKRFGINVDGRNPADAAQHIKNILVNPGFEAGAFSSIIHVGAGSTVTRWFMPIAIRTSQQWVDEICLPQF